ncbi:MAG: SGNH/GDSL hydrolase family protein [Acetatifactor sp.]
MKFYDITEYPIKIYGLAIADKEKRQFWKLPPNIIQQFPQYNDLGRRSVGGRVRFQTNSKSLCVRMTLAATKVDAIIPLSGSASADIYLGKGKEASYLGYVAPTEYTNNEITTEKTFFLSGNTELVTINLPRNDFLLAMEIGIDDETELLPAPDYTFSNPIVFYGSSITEGGCAPRPGNAYTSLVSRWLDADYKNMGFSGRARGELGFAKYLASFDNMSAFVMDYDHNSPSPEHLQETHEPFFLEMRKTHPNLPILIISRPDTDKYPEEILKRKQIIKTTYENARAAGDEKVWFLDGGELFDRQNRMECTVDGTHPNALGFMRMAEKIYPVLKSILAGDKPII